MTPVGPMHGDTADERDRTLGQEGSVRSVPSRATRIPRRELLTLVAYVEAGSHKAAAHRLGIAESTCRQRVSLLMTRVGARNAAQAAWRLRRELEAEIRPSPHRDGSAGE